MSTVYLNGEFLPLEEARVPVLDRGFIFGDGVYEVMPAFAGQLFRFEAHMQRLENSLSQVRIPNPFSRQQWRDLFERLLAANGGGDFGVYFQLTRGVGRRDHIPSEDMVPTVFVMCNPITAHEHVDEVAALSMEDIRWRYCNIKAIALLPNILLRMQAADQGAYEAILIRDGLVTEGAASNVFVVNDGVVRTPPKSEHLLPGITRDVIMELLADSDIPHAEADIPAAWLESAAEIWLTSSTREIIAVTQLDGRRIGDGHAGPLCQRVMALYQGFKRSHLAKARDRQGSG